MAIFHLTVSSVQRSKGSSAVAAAAYAEDRTMRDERQGKTFRYGNDHTAKHDATVCLGSYLPDGTKIDTSLLWNAAERAEKRKDAQTARKIETALPVELDREAHTRIAEGFRDYLSKRFKVATTAAAHYEHERNPHIHWIMTTREITTEAGSPVFGKKTRCLDVKKTSSEEVDLMREEWARLCNTELEKAKVTARIDHRSYVRRGIDLLPEIHIGITGMRMQKTGSTSTRWIWNEQRKRTRAAQVMVRLAKKRVKYARRIQQNLDHDPGSETRYCGSESRDGQAEKGNASRPGADRGYVGSAAGRRASSGQRSGRHDQGRDRGHVVLDQGNRQRLADREQRFDQNDGQDRPESKHCISFMIDEIEARIKTFKDQIDLQNIGERSYGNHDSHDRPSCR